jgi:hypothetical protein
MFRRGTAWLGKAGQGAARLGVAGHGLAGQGTARQGRAWPGVAGHGEARRGWAGSEKNMSEQSKPVTFTNGLTPEQDDKIDDLRIGLSRMRREIEELGRHRTYSLAITKIEEAEHWLQARKHQAAQ